MKKLGHNKSIAYEPWTTFSEEYCKEDSVKIMLSVNGKVRGSFEIDADKASDKELLEKMALENEAAKKFIDGHEIVKKIIVPGKLVNIVVK